MTYRRLGATTIAVTRRRLPHTTGRLAPLFFISEIGVIEMTVPSMLNDNKMNDFLNATKLLIFQQFSSNISLQR